MASRSIRWPPVLSGGRLLMTPDPDDPRLTPEDRGIELRQLLAICVQDATGANPFNAGAGLGVRDATFSGQSNGSKAQVRARIETQFRRLEAARRARLTDVTFAKGEAAGELLVQITYEDLETGSRQRLEQALA